MLRVLVFRHVPFEKLGLIEPALAARGIGIDHADLYVPGTPVPDITGYSGLIFLGGPMSVNDPLPYLRAEEALIGQAWKRGLPMLGICLGSQLIAHTMGGEVRRNGAKEIGWFEVRFNEAAAEDPLFGGLTTETVFHWHGETFDLPAGAELLASSELCRNQAFRLGANVYGLQFHLEVTGEVITDWCSQDANAGDMREVEHPIDPGFNAARLETLSSRVFGKWCEMLQPVV